MGAIARVLSIALATAGVILLVEVATTLVWQEPMSALYASAGQRDADAELDSLSAEYRDSAPETESSDPDSNGNESPVQRERRQQQRLERQLAASASEFRETIAVGDPIGRIRAPRMGLDLVAFYGTDTSTLRYGPGIYPERSLPGQPGTTAVAGHRTTYGSPFRHIDKLRKDDRITLEMPYGTFTYSVESAEIVLPSDVGVVDHTAGRQRLVLTACHPLYSAAQRYVVSAELVSTEPPSA